MPRKDYQAHLAYMLQYCRQHKAERNKYCKQYRIKNREALLISDRKRSRPGHLKRRYGITMSQYDTLCESQGFLCKICNQPETALDRSGKVKYLSVDHDHKTGRIRGLLCHGCNVALGAMKDSSDRLRSAAVYLDSSI